MDKNARGFCMGKLIFYYGTMGCAKTANALMVRYQHIQNNRRVWLIKPAIDTRDDKESPVIRSRIGLEAPVRPIQTKEDIHIVYAEECSTWPPDVIICDEAQFFTAEQITQLKDLAINNNIDILCYGLRTDFKTKAFEGSLRLFEIADELISLSNVCDCGAPATVNARFTKSGKMDKGGSKIMLGGDELYKAICWKCYRRNQVE